MQLRRDGNTTELRMEVEVYSDDGNGNGSERGNSSWCTALTASGWASAKLGKPGTLVGNRRERDFIPAGLRNPWSYSGGSLHSQFHIYMGNVGEMYCSRKTCSLTRNSCCTADQEINWKKMLKIKSNAMIDPGGFMGVVCEAVNENMLSLLLTYLLNYL